MKRAELLDEEYLRDTPGLRPFSVGILKLCRKLGLKLATGGKAVPEESEREVLFVAWLLDERNSIEEIKRMAAQREQLEAVVDLYEFTLSPARIMMVKDEVERTNAAVNAALVEVAPKPGPNGPAPPGES